MMQRDLDGNDVVIAVKDNPRIHVDEYTINLCRHLKVFTPLDMMNVTTAALKLATAMVKILDDKDWEKIVNAEDTEEIREILRTRI